MAPPNKPAAKETGTFGQLNGVTISGAIVLTVGLILVVYYTMFYSSVVEQAERERRRTDEVQAQYTAARGELRRYNADVTELVRAKTRTRELRRVLPETADIPGLMRSINQLAEGSGLQIGLIEPEDEKVEQYYVRIPVRLEVTGGYLSLTRFFRAVSTLPRVINMENIMLEVPAEGQGSHGSDGRLQAKVLATTFRALGPGETAAAAPGAAVTAQTPAGGRR